MSRFGLERGVVMGGWMLRRILGSGSFGEVWLVSKDFQPSRMRALKLVEAEERSLTERDTLFDLEHPHIVTVSDSFDASRGAPPNTIGIVMNLGDGTLSGRIEPGALNHEQIRRVGVELASGLSYLHNDGGTERAIVVHGDIKPSNVLRASDRWQLSDFGLSVTTETGSAPLTGVSWGYAPPEYAIGDELGLRLEMSRSGDIWALGVTLWELWSASHPGGFESVLGAVASESSTSPLLSIITACLNPEPTQRPSALAVFDVFDDVPRAGSVEPALTVRHFRGLFADVRRLNGWLAVGAEADRWVRRSDRNGFYSRALADLLAVKDYSTARTLLDAAEWWNELPVRDPLPGVGQMLTTAEVETARAALVEVL